MIARPTITAVLALTGLVVAQNAAQDAGLLKGLTDPRLLTLGWAREAIDLDYDAAARAYEVLVQRQTANLRHRNRALLRLIAIRRNQGDFAGLVPVLKKLAADKTLPQSGRRRLRQVVQLLNSPVAKRAGKLIAERRGQHDTKAHELGGTPSSSPREKERQKFLNELQQAMKKFPEMLRPLGRRPNSVNLLVGAKRRNTQQQRERELLRLVRELTDRTRRLAAQGKSGTAEWTAADKERRRVEGQYRSLFRSRTLRELRQLYARIRRLEKQKEFVQADFVISQAERLMKNLNGSSSRRAMRLPQDLRDVVRRRRALRGILRTIPALQRRLTQRQHLEHVESIKTWRTQIQPLVAAKRWGEASALTLAFLEQNRWLAAMWRNARRRNARRR